MRGQWRQDRGSSHEVSQEDGVLEHSTEMCFEGAERSNGVEVIKVYS